MPIVVVANGDPSLRHELGKLLPAPRYDFLPVPNRGDLLDRIGAFDLLVAECGELGLVRAVRSNRPSVPVIVIARDSSEDLAICALKLGVTDYYKVPVDVGELATAIANRLGPPDDPEVAGVMIGENPSMESIRRHLARVALTESNVLITGETGTGKELAAESIHRASVRRRQPFICINCAALPDTLLESELFGHERGAFTGAISSQQGKLRQADGGTVFFDEIGDMSPFAQAKILRAIETKEIYALGGRHPIRLDIRIIAATNRDLEWLARQDRFRADLLFRLDVTQVRLPPLRERKSDIPLLLSHFLRTFNRRFGCRAEGFAEEALERLLCYDWPGNIRELKNVVEAALINPLAGPISLSDLPERFHPDAESEGGLDERARLIAALLATNWNVSKAARRLHWSRMTLYRKLAKYQVVRSAVAAGCSV